MTGLVVLEFLIIVLLIFFLIRGLIKRKKSEKNLSAMIEKYSPIINMEKELAKLAEAKKVARTEVKILKASYAEKRKIFDQLVRQMAIYDEEIELAELGFYKPHYSYDTSEKFKDEIANVKSKQKGMVKNKEAIYCHTEWTLEGSKAKGRTMTNRNIKMTARAFNNECDAAIASVKWNNATRMEQRIVKAFEAINKLNESNQIYISPSYLNLKLEELRLTHEYKEKKQEEKEEQAELKRQMKEEAKIQKEAERAQKELEQQEAMLAEIRRQVEEATGERLAELNRQIEEYEAEKEKNERKISLAQQTKRGVVYIISNIGSFGENIFKIGMTRREDPEERVKELSNASVPFSFDIHATIKSEDAPELENRLHKMFDHRRVNLVNSRKEFFDVTFDEIKKEVKTLSLDAEIYETIEAREYRESLALRNRKSEALKSTGKQVEMPDSI